MKVAAQEDSDDSGIVTMVTILMNDDYPYTYIVLAV